MRSLRAMAYFSNPNSTSFAQCVDQSLWKAKQLSLDTLRPAASSKAPRPSFARKLNRTIECDFGEVSLIQEVTAILRS